MERDCLAVVFFLACMYAHSRIQPFSIGRKISLGLCEKKIESLRQLPFMPS